MKYNTYPTKMFVYGAAVYLMDVVVDNSILLHTSIIYSLPQYYSLCNSSTDTHPYFIHVLFY